MQDAKSPQNKGWPTGLFFLPARSHLTRWSGDVSPRAGFSNDNLYRIASAIHREAPVEKLQKQALQVTKEIVVKFIETGRISPTNFPDYFSKIYNEVLATISAEDDNAQIQR
jgi:hypothetical protein